MKTFAVLALAGALAAGLWSFDKKKKKEEETQTLQVPPELPGETAIETRRLAYYLSPLSARGLLSQQTRDALKALSRQAGGSPITKIRAFVAGTGDLRRVRELVSEHFSDRRQPLPALSLVQVGSLPLEGAQVELEATAQLKKEPQSAGLVFVSAQGASSNQPLDPVAPLAATAGANLRTALAAAGSGPRDVLRVTCFFSSLENLPALRAPFDAEYRGAALGYVQLQRAPSRAVAACEAVARLRHPAAALEFLNPAGLPPANAFSQVALVGAPRLVLTGTQVAFGFQDSDARLAFERLGKSLDHAGSSLRNIAFASVYPLSPSIEEQVRRIGPEFYDRSRPPAGTMLLFESLPAMDAGFALDAAGVVAKP